MPAELRSVAPLCDDGVLKLSFNLQGGEVVRLKLSAASVAWLRQALCEPDYWRSAAGNQSPASSGSPSEPRSVPLGDVEQCPPAASSTAC